MDELQKLEENWGGVVIRQQTHFKAKSGELAGWDSAADCRFSTSTNTTLI
jgi:hypothetical protein